MCDLPFRLFGTRRRFGGPCVTLRAADHGPVAAILSEQGHGRVLVVDSVPACPSVAMLGDRLATLAAKNGWEGVVVNGSVRDTALLAQLPIAIAALGATPRRAARASMQVERDQVLEFGGAVFHPGFWIAGDEDGIVTCKAAVLDRL